MKYDDSAQLKMKKNQEFTITQQLRVDDVE